MQRPFLAWLVRKDRRRLNIARNKVASYLATEHSPLQLGVVRA
jgi:hypothetical protein